MQYMKKTLVFLTLIGIVVISVWQLRQREASPALLLPEAGATIATQEQQAVHVTAATTDSSEWARRHAIRKSAADVESVTRAFKEASDCLLYHVARHELRIFSTDERLADLSNEMLATLESIDAASSRYLSIARQTEAFCIGSDREVLARVYSDAILEAALLGNPDAESCFVISSISPLETIAPASWEVLENRYLKYAPIFTQNALERGDPYVARMALYRHVASLGVHPSRLDDLQKPDPYLTWKMARLASLRALPEQRMILEDWLVRFEEQNLLKSDDIRRADAWARAAYERQFAGQPPIDLNSQVPCYSSPDLAP